MVKVATMVNGLSMENRVIDKLRDRGFEVLTDPAWDHDRKTDLATFMRHDVPLHAIYEAQLTKARGNVLKMEYFLDIHQEDERSIGLYVEVAGRASDVDVAAAITAEIEKSEAANTPRGAVLHLCTWGCGRVQSGRLEAEIQNLRRRIEDAYKTRPALSGVITEFHKDGFLIKGEDGREFFASMKDIVDLNLFKMVRAEERKQKNPRGFRVSYLEDNRPPDLPEANVRITGPRLPRANYVKEAPIRRRLLRTG